MNKQIIFAAAHKAAKSGPTWMKYAKRFKSALVAEYAKARAAKVFLSVDQILSNIKKIDPAFSAVVTGGYITGYYRGKSSQGYKFDIANRVCLFDNAGFSSIITKIFTA